MYGMYVWMHISEERRLKGSGMWTILSVTPMTIGMTLFMENATPSPETSITP
jgi:hypothetical protein